MMIIKREDANIKNAFEKEEEPKIEDNNSNPNMNLDGAEIETVQEEKEEYSDNNYYKKGKGGNYKNNEKYNYNDKYNNKDKYYDKYNDKYYEQDNYYDGKYYKNKDKYYNNDYYGYKDYGGKKNYKGGYNDYEDINKKEEKYYLMVMI